MVRENDLIEFDDKAWCVNHLPLRAREIESPKSQWDDARVKKFNEDIFELVQQVKAADRFLNLTGVTFPGDVDFGQRKDRVLPKLTFEHAVFGGRVSFRDCTFADRARFDNATFCDAAMFSKATFEDVVFLDARFCGRAIFDMISANVMANFIGARFGKDVLFGRAVLVAGLFAHAAFGGKARFKRAEFRGYQVVFSWARFAELAEFDGTVFKCHALFEEVIFDDDARFVGDTTSEGVDRGSDTFAASVNFRSTTFGGRANFINRRFLGPTDFRDATFQVAPEFHNATIHQDTDFSGTTFLDRNGTEYVNAAMAYRTLKLAMESLRASDEEARFFGYEQQSLRARADTPWSVKLFSWLYEKTAGYGQSIVRPLVWMLGIFVVFSLIYLATMHDGPTITWADGEHVLQFALQQVFQPFGTFRSVADPVSLGLAVVAALHSLLTFGLLALFLLSLRRRFKLN